MTSQLLETLQAVGMDVDQREALAAEYGAHVGADDNVSDVVALLSCGTLSHEAVHAWALDSLQTSSDVVRFVTELTRATVNGELTGEAAEYFQNPNVLESIGQSQQERRDTATMLAAKVGGGGKVTILGRINKETGSVTVNVYGLQRFPLSLHGSAALRFCAVLDEYKAFCEKYKPYFGTATSKGKPIPAALIGPGKPFDYTKPKKESAE